MRTVAGGPGPGGRGPGGGDKDVAEGGVARLGRNTKCLRDTGLFQGEAGLAVEPAGQGAASSLSTSTLRL